MATVVKHPSNLETRRVRHRHQQAEIDQAATEALQQQQRQVKNC